MEGGEWYFSETAASKSAMLLSILKRSFRARENERAIVLRAVSSQNWGSWTWDVRLRSAIGLPFSVHLVVGHFEDRRVVGYGDMNRVLLKVESLFESRGVVLFLVISIRGSPQC